MVVPVVWSWAGEMASDFVAGRALRADARRNRARILETAINAFAENGLSVSVHEIARRAGVGTGTVSRHFPTKEALYEAIVLTRVEEMVEHGRRLAATLEPGPAFFAFFTYMVEQGTTDQGLAEALAGAGFDIDGAVSRAEHDLPALENELLGRAQEAEAVRKDIDIADVKALVVGCLARERGPAAPQARQRMIDIATAGLRPS
jgi:AcrR family transcriptional regulator